VTDIKGVGITGYTNLDKNLNHLGEGHLMVITGESSVGKTTFNLNVLVNMLKKGLKVLFYSTEMSKKEVLLKLKQIDPEIDWRSLYIDDDPEHQIIHVLHDTDSLNDINPDVIAVDTVDHFRTLKPTRPMELRDVLDCFRKMARRQKCFVVCVSQEEDMKILNRDAHVVMEVHRDVSLESGQDRSLCCIIRKNRKGKLCGENLIFDKNFSKVSQQV
jgi:archaellum biogenesis ATPase FlaH